MKRSNYSDNIETGNRSLYLQTHSQENPPEAVSVLFQQGQVLGKMIKLLSDDANGDRTEKATELFHMENVDTIRGIINTSLNLPEFQGPAKLIRIIRLLIQWGLFPEALSITETVDEFFPQNSDILRFRGEALANVTRYRDAVKILTRSYHIESKNSRTLQLIVFCLINISEGISNKDKQDLLQQKIKKCLNRIKILTPNLSFDIDKIMEEICEENYQLARDLSLHILSIKLIP